MPLQRTNPLPIGVYHIDVVAAKLPAFIAWRKANKGTVKVRKTEETSGIAWILFEVLSPTSWDGPQFGFPNIAEKGLNEVRTPAFTPQRDVLDQVADALPQPADLKWLIWGTAGITAFLIYREFTKE